MFGKKEVLATSVLPELYKSETESGFLKSRDTKCIFLGKAYVFLPYQTS